MKKTLVALVLALALLAGFGFLRGWHHTLALLPKLNDWLQGQVSAQTVELTGGGLQLQSQLFWQDYGGDRIYGSPEAGIYLLEDLLVMDSGRAYALELPEPSRSALWSLLLLGKMTRTETDYHFEAGGDGWSLQADFRAGDQLEQIRANAVLEGSPWSVTIRRQEAQPQQIPAAVRDAIVLARMERPMNLREPLEALLPALAALEAPTADVTLGVECGILNLSETVQMEVRGDTALLRREDLEFQVSIPDALENLSPVAVGLLLLKHGEFQPTEDGALFRCTPPPGDTEELSEDLVPQLLNLGLTFDTASAEITIRDGRIRSVDLAAGGTVSLLITTLPIAFSAVFLLTNS